MHTREETPRFTAELHAYVEERAALRNRGPLAALWSKLRLPSMSRARDSFEGPTTDPKVADRLIERYLKNKTMIETTAAAFGVRPVFVWQPISVYHYDVARHPTRARGAQPLPGVGAQRLAERLKAQPLGPTFIWAADIQATVPDPLYVDAIHYAPNLCRGLARFVADAAVGRGLLK
jgi:hypothetical protein